MSDLILLITIVVFFLIAAQLVRACGPMTAATVEGLEPADSPSCSNPADGA